MDKRPPYSSRMIADSSLTRTANHTKSKEIHYSPLIRNINTMATINLKHIHFLDPIIENVEKLEAKTIFTGDLILPSVILQNNSQVSFESIAQSSNTFLTRFHWFLIFKIFSLFLWWTFWSFWLSSKLFQFWFHRKTALTWVDILVWNYKLKYAFELNLITPCTSVNAVTVLTARTFGKYRPLGVRKCPTSEINKSTKIPKSILHQFVGKPNYKRSRCMIISIIARFWRKRGARGRASVCAWERERDN